MIAWMIVIGYLTGFLFFGRLFAVRMLDRELRAETSIYSNPVESAEFWRPFYVGTGFAMSAVWPVSAPLYFFWWLLHFFKFETTAEREYLEREELKALRKQAEELGLPMPEDARRLDG